MVLYRHGSGQSLTEARRKQLRPLFKQRTGGLIEPGSASGRASEKGHSGAFEKD